MIEFVFNFQSISLKKKKKRGFLLQLLKIRTQIIIEILGTA